MVGLDLCAWSDELTWRERSLRSRSSSPAAERYDRAANRLTVAAIRASADGDGLGRVVGWLRRARYGNRLGRIWSRARIGELLVAAEGRLAQIELGRIVPKAKGPRLDPARLPDERLDALIQTHRDLGVVEALRAERRRRQEDHA